MFRPSTREASLVIVLVSTEASFRYLRDIMKISPKQYGLELSDASVSFSALWLTRPMVDEYQPYALK